MPRPLFPEQLLFHLSWLVESSDPEVEEEEEGNREEDAEEQFGVLLITWNIGNHGCLIYIHKDILYMKRN